MNLPQRLIEPAGIALLIGERLRTCADEATTYVVAANEFAAATGIEQVVLWRTALFKRPHMAAVAGLSNTERNTPFSEFVEALARALAGQRVDGLVELTDDILPPALREERAANLLPYAYVAYLTGPDGAMVGGLVACSREPLTDSTQAVARASVNVMAHALWAWRAKWDVPFAHLRRRFLPGKKRLLLAAILVAISFVPVRMSAVAPAEVTARQPLPVTAPSDGVVERVWVRPNQAVKKGDVLLSYDEAVVRSRLEVARKAVEVARAEFSRAAGKAFQDEAARTELQTLRSRVQERIAETSYLEQLAQRLQIRSPVDGVAIFGDAEEWTGRPIQTGERVMTIANPQKVWLTIYLPPDEAIPASDLQKVKMHLDVDPLYTIRGVIVESSYESVMNPQGNPAYLLRAQFEEGGKLPRIGLKGTAVIYGDYAPLIYYVLRKPFRALRRITAI